MKTRFLLPSLLVSLATLPALAAQRSWDGGDPTPNMTAAANWNGNTVISPAADSLLFPTGLPPAERTVTNNYPANTLFHRLQFMDGYTFGGTILGLDQSLTSYQIAGVTMTVNAGLSLQNSVLFNVSEGDLVFGAGSQIYLNGQTAEFMATFPSAVLNIGGLLAGAGQINVTRAGSVRLSGAKTFTAPVGISDGGTLVIDNAGSLGTGAGTTSINDGTLELDSAAALSIPERILMNNTDPASSYIVSGGGAHTLSGPIEFAGDWFKRFDVQGTSLTLSGAMSGPDSSGSMTKQGPGRLILSGAASNTAGIQIFGINAGEVFLNKSGGATAISSPFVILGTNAVLPHNSILRLGASHQIKDATRVDLGSDGWFDLNGRQETIASLQFRGSGHVTGNGGTLRLEGGVEAFSAAQNGGVAVIDGALTLAAANSEWEVLGGAEDIDLTVNGTVTSLVPGGVLTKSGTGELFLTGTVAVPQILLNDGRITMNGNSPSTHVTVNASILADALYATGTLGNVTALSGGIIPGPSGTNATLNCGDLTITGPGETWLSYTSALPGEHDRVNVTGTVTLSDATLNLFALNPAVLAAGDEMVLISNDGADPVAGEFAGFPEGHIFTNGLGEGNLLSYKGGDGNDISLTHIVVPTGVTRLWDGGGADNNWMTANNWNPNGVPQPGDDLVFPTVAARKANANNFPAGTTFQSLTVHGTGYTLGGNGITLNEKVEFTSASGSHFLSLPLTLALDATISITGNGFVQATAPINLNGHKLTLHNAGGGTGDLYVSGNIMGAGRVWKTGPGSITFFEQPNAYSGPTDIMEGTLALKADATLGATGAANGTTIRSGATLLLRNNEGSVNVGETLVLHDGSTVTDSDGATFTTTLTGPIQILSGTATIHIGANIGYIASVISGAGGLRKNGPGILRFYGVQPNTFSGGFFADQGRVLGAKTNGPAFPGPVTVGAPGLSPDLEFEAHNQIGDNAVVRVVESGALRPAGYSDTIGSLTLQGGSVPESGTLTLQTGILNVEASPSYIVTLYCNVVIPPGVTGQFTIANGNNLEDADLAFNGVLTGDAVEQNGPGTMVWYHDLPGGALGALKIKSGISIMHGQCPALPVTLEGGTLAGKGRVASITTLTSGGLRPGEDIGVFNNTRFLSAGTVTLNAATTCSFRLWGLNPAVDYNQLFPSTALTLGGAALDITCINGFVPAPGDSFMIIRSTTGTPPTGTFAGIPQNGYVSTAGAKVFQVNYAGGDGDDVVLTCVEVTAPEIVAHSMSPGLEDHKGFNDTDLTVHGTPGLTYQLESSTNLQNWTALQSAKADLQTGLMQFEFFNPETDPRLFLRVRLP